MTTPPILPPASPSGRIYGWRPDLPDLRDRVYSATAPTVARPLPGQCLYWPLKFPAVYDQEPLGSCTAQGIAAPIHAEGLREGLVDPAPARLFIYLEERRIERTLDRDDGAQIRTGMKVVSTLGAPPESLWGYDIRRFREKPPAAVYAAGLKRKVLRYERVRRNLNALKSAIALDGVTPVFGFTVYESFEADALARHGQMTIPERGEAVLGGHCSVMLGYDDAHVNGPHVADGAMLIRNSYGPDHGIHDLQHPEFNGHFWMPYSALMMPGFADDFWVIQKVDGKLLTK